MWSLYMLSLHHMPLLHHQSHCGEGITFQGFLMFALDLGCKLIICSTFVVILVSVI